MAKNLKERWKVGTVGMILILTTFAIGGSLSGWLAKKAMAAFDWEKGLLWWITYIFLVSIFWPICVITVSLLTGQFKFFKNYLKRMYTRMFSKKPQAKVSPE